MYCVRCCVCCIIYNNRFSELASKLTQSDFACLGDPAQRLKAAVRPSPYKRPPPGPAEFRAGELKVFVSILVPTTAYRSVVPMDERVGMDDMLAMVHYFRARDPPGGKQRRSTSASSFTFDVYDPRSLAKTVPFPLMTLAYQGAGASRVPCYDLVDTEALSSPVWSQQDFRNPELRWLIKPRIVYRA